VGQYLIKHLKKEFEAKKRTVVYGDTDSIFFVLADGENIEDVQRETNDYLAQHITKEFGTTRCTIRMGIDKHFDKFLICNIHYFDRA
jgi:DNA polymerase elongation subunit (family B)